MYIYVYIYTSGTRSSNMYSRANELSSIYIYIYIERDTYADIDVYIDIDRYR